MKIPFQARVGAACAGGWLAAASLGFATLALAETRPRAAADIPREAVYALTPAQQYGLALEAQTEQDHAALLYWLRASASAGHLPAQELLGVVLLGGPVLYGDGMSADPCEARHWLGQAALNGSVASMPRALVGRPHGQAPGACR